MRTLLPSDHPRVSSPCRNASILTFVSASPSGKPISTPMRCIRSGCQGRERPSRDSSATDYFEKLAPSHCHPRVSRNSVLFDHLVGTLLNRQRHRNVKRPGGLEIDDQLE